MRQLMRDKVTLVKKTGEVVKSDIAALVNASDKSVLTQDTKLPYDKGDHILRKLPNGFVEDWVISEANFLAGPTSRLEFFKLQVQRTDQPAAPAAIVIQGIQNSRVYVNSTDNSVNVIANDISSDALGEFVKQVRPFVSQFPETTQDAVSAQLDVIDKELSKPKQSQSVIRESLASLRKIGESATGGIFSHGLLGLIDNLL